MAAVTEGTLVLSGGALGRVTRVGKQAGAEGAWISSTTGDPGSTTSYPTFSPDFCIKPAVIGESVCPKPRFACYCGLTHLPADQLAWVPGEAA